MDPAMDLETAYQLLGVRPGSSYADAHAQFRRRAKATHPDVVLAELRDGATRRAAELIVAWRLVEADLRAVAAQPATRPGHRRPHEDECEVCGTCPAANLTVRRVTGVLVVSPVTQARARLCRGCARAACAEWQALNLVRGWWSIFGPVVVPFVFLTNVLARQGHRRRTPGTPTRAGGVDVPESAPLPSRPVLRAPVVASCLAVAGLLALLVLSVR